MPPELDLRTVHRFRPEGGAVPYGDLSVLYSERARLVALLAASYPSALVHGADPRAPGWPVVYVELPTGQCSWHIAPGDIGLFDHVPTVPNHIWDGHDGAERDRRVSACTGQLVRQREKQAAMATSLGRAGMGRPRLFHLQRHRDVSGVSGIGRVADGVEWPDGTVAVRWNGGRPSTVTWDSLDDLLSVSGHGGATEVVFDDEARPQLAPITA
jgi:hypothetical protein